MSARKKTLNTTPQRAHNPELSSSKRTNSSGTKPRASKALEPPLDLQSQPEAILEENSKRMSGRKRKQPE
jgi:hypothetical protein